MDNYQEQLAISLISAIESIDDEHLTEALKEISPAALDSLHEAVIDEEHRRDGMDKLR